MKKKRSAKEKITTLTGTITVTQKGFGFVTPDDSKKHTQDVFIPKSGMGGAVDGDRIECSIDPIMRSPKGPEGVVIAILERGRSEIVGTVEEIQSKTFLRIHAPAIGAGKTVLVQVPPKHTIAIGERLLVKVETWGEKQSPTICTLVEKIGHISDPKTDIPSAALEYKISSTFPSKALQEAKMYGKSVAESDLVGRKDLTGLEIFTIDPKTAKDFDDALSLEITKNGNFLLGVHIADVSHYVKEGSHLDIEASLRSNSTYFPGKCIPMIPHELSDNLCSLREKVIRLTISVFIEFSPDGKLLSSSIERSYINSQKRFTYEDAYAVLQGKKRSKHAKKLAMMRDLCLLLKKERSLRGSIDLSLSETILTVDADGNPTGFETVEYDITHQLVEEFMLKANEIVAKWFIDNKLSTVFRIHEEPLEETMEEFYAIARGLGFTVPAKPDPKDIQALFSKAKESPYAHQLSVAFIRSMRLAMYSHENVGHYGLALEHYCHFTSPIRRYSDLIVHRMLFTKTPPEDIEKIAERCSEKERNSFKAEQNVITIKKLRMLEKAFAEDESKVYTAKVSKVKPHGIYFDIDNFALTGYLHISRIGSDFFEFSEAKNCIYGRGSRIEYTVGTPLSVTLSRIDLIRGETEWESTDQREKKKKDRTRPKKRKK